MSNVCVNEQLPYDADRVWSIVRRFDDVSLLEGLVDDIRLVEDGERCERIVRMSGLTLRQRLESRDDAERTMRIRTVETDHPLDTMVATMRVRPTADNACELVWESTLEASSNEAMFASLARDFYIAAIGRLKTRLARG